MRTPDDYSERVISTRELRDFHGNPVTFETVVATWTTESGQPHRETVTRRRLDA